MVPLSSRPGRADRAMFTWAAAGILMGAITVGALGWQLGQAAHVARGAAQAAGAQRVEELRKLETTLQIPNLSTDPKPVETLNGRISKLREDGRKVRAPRPVLEEIARLMKSLDGIEDVRLTEFECNAMFNAKAELVVPDAETGPEVLEKLRSIPGQLVWTGSVPASFGGPTQRKYVLLGLWPQEGGTP